MEMKKNIEFGLLSRNLYLYVHARNVKKQQYIGSALAL